MWGVAFFGVASAIGYFAKFWHKVDDSVKNRRRRELLIMAKRRKKAEQAGRCGRGDGTKPLVAGGLAWELNLVGFLGEDNPPDLAARANRSNVLAIPTHGNPTGITHKDARSFGIAQICDCPR